MGRAVEAALRSGEWLDLRVDVECANDAGLRSVTLYGDGVGIWNRARQFTLGREAMVSVLEAFRRADFAKLREAYGGRADPDRPKLVLKVVCGVSLGLGGARKRVTQLESGRQSPALKRLAREVLATCEQPARSGTAAESLADGLRKLAEGTLTPEALSVMAHRKGDTGPDPEGWLLRIEGRRVSARTYKRSQGYADPVVLELAREEVAALALLLLENDLEGLPGNLYAEEYTDLVVELLDREKRIQARRFAGMEPTTHGAKQADFDRIFDTLHQLHMRALAEGKPEPIPGDS